MILRQLDDPISLKRLRETAACWTCRRRRRLLPQKWCRCGCPGWWYDKWVDENSPNIPPLRFEVYFFTVVKTQWLSIGAFFPLRNIYWLHQKSCLDGQTPLILSDRTCDGTAICIWKQGHRFRGLRLVSIPCTSSGMIIQVVLLSSLQDTTKKRFPEASDQWFGTFFEGKFNSQKTKWSFCFSFGMKKNPTDLMFPLISRLQALEKKMWLFCRFTFLFEKRPAFRSTKTFGCWDSMAFKSV